jgi:hypothetical protein
MKICVRSKSIWFQQATPFAVTEIEELADGMDRSLLTKEVHRRAPHFSRPCKQLLCMVPTVHKCSCAGRLPRTRNLPSISTPLCPKSKVLVP